MATITWGSGKDLRRFVKELIAWRDALYAECEAALRDSVTEGALLLQDLLEAAETETGRRRAKTGGSAGRHRSGNMIASVSHNGDAILVSGTRRDASFGWYPENYEAYFKLQDLGSTTAVEWPDKPGLMTTIPGAMAMAQASMVAREEFRRRMSEIVSK